jgi:hypothetical protein
MKDESVKGSQHVRLQNMQLTPSLESGGTRQETRENLETRLQTYPALLGHQSFDPMEFRLAAQM